MNARAVVLALLLAAGAASALVAIPKPTSPITDLTGTLDAGQLAALDARLRAFERQKGSQIAVLLVPTTQPETIEQYAIRVADEWKPGRKGIDDGVLLVVAKDDRALRIDVRYGLEGALPDAIANRIIEEIITPRFRDGDYYGGISDGIDRMIKVIEGEPLPPATRGVAGDGSLPPNALWILFLAPLAVGGLVRATLNRFSGATAAGALAGGLGWWITGAAGVALGFGVFCFLFTLLGGLGGRRRGGWSSGGWGGGYSGGGWGGGGLGGGGGWSGGGGLGGGGGASGRW